MQRRQRSFKDVKGRARADLAMKYVRDSRMSLSQIAEVPGYSEPSAFSRAFQRWHGTAATRVRRR